MYRHENIEGYAKALFELSVERGEFKNNLLLLDTIDKCLKQNYSYMSVLGTHAYDKEKKYQLIDELFNGLATSSIVPNFLKLLIHKDAFSLLPKIISHFDELANEAMNIKKATIYTAFKLSTTNKTKFKNYLAKKYNCKIDLENIIDKNLISGFRIEIDSDVIEHNFALDLEKLSNLIIDKGD
ncbi:ATP synthase F1 subunit delta [Mycoplasmopsis mucosicanis]|uniref:ATP synthase subunit delta n=1 Tax=Mycoplasmopsis mucosicanis TaxID=458208 RepID=A0A507SJA4_9BACT|nr:ATP synthase F1 subunit delta [Mycoplasmopsis mucosicanis]TQC51301.1 ATP synthase F1 subunit delta [Mycoplasmopsis mucosicanis]